MTARRALGRGVRLASAAALGLAALASLTGIAQARSAQPNAKPAAPLRAIFYLTAPLSVKGLSGRPLPRTTRDNPAALKSHLAALAWARADAAIIPWSPGSSADRKLAAVLATFTSAHAHVRVVALIDRPHGSEASQLQALTTSRATDRSYLRVGHRPAIFVALADRSLRTCAAAHRWRVAASAFWLAQATFPGYGRCLSTADAWFRDEPDSLSARASGTFLIRPGYWPIGATHPTLARSTDAWRRSIQQMNASGAPLEIVDSLNNWAHGSAIEPSAAWPSGSGFGGYLDALHALPPGVVAGVAAPSVEGVEVSGVTAHGGTITATVAAGSAAAAWSVEYGATTAYGQTTAPAALPAASPRHAVTVSLPALSAATTYHLRIDVASSVAVVASADVMFTTLPAGQVIRIAAAGDIACDPDSIFFGVGTADACHEQSVSDAILAGNYDAVLPLGDEQYNSGTASAFATAYQPSWGRFKLISHPVVGNHEYGSPGAAPYFQYFGASAGEPGKGYYSYDLGAWHLIALNSNCAQVGGCAAGSPEELWLRADLSAHAAGCTLAYWHHPLFTSGQEGDAESMTTIWADLYAAAADVVLNGHDHDYERFAPQNPEGTRDDARGIREFVVGTGGKNHMTFRTIEANSEAQDASTFGFLELTLSDGGYSWRFVADPPGTFTDSGSGTCH